MLAVVGIVAALYEREHSGRGQVIDAAMVDGVSILASTRSSSPGSACRPMLPAQMDRSSFAAMHALFAQRFATRTRDEWTEIFAGTDACVTPVLTWSEAAHNEHLRTRETVVTVNGVDQAAPAPRFSRTPANPVGAPPQTATPVDRIRW